MAPRNGRRRTVKAVGLLLAGAFAVLGFVVAFGEWGVGYCGALTGDAIERGTLQHDLCRGTSGNVMGGVVVASWILAAVSPLLGMRLALRTHTRWPFAVVTALGATPILVILVLGRVLPQG